MEHGPIAIPRAPVRSAAIPPSPPIDAVYTWVDGDRLPELAEWRQRLDGTVDPSAASPCRFRDNGELRYALRSLERYAPWVRRVFLVTSGQVPDWLDARADGLTLVTHADVFPDPGVLPVFNTAAIHAVVPRIPGLADHYLQIDDDVLFGRPTAPTDFLTADGGTIVNVESWPAPTELLAPTVVRRRLAFNRLRLLPGPVRMLAHAPQLIDRAGARRVWDRWRPDFERTLTHRFRRTDDAQLIFLHLNLRLAEGPPNEVRTNEDDLMKSVQVGPDHDTATSLAAVPAEPFSINVNDEVDDFEADGWRWDLVRAFLEERFPAASRFERRYPATDTSSR